MIKTVGELTKILASYDANLPIQAIVMNGGFEIKETSLEQGWNVDEDKETEVACLHIACELPLYIP